MKISVIRQVVEQGLYKDALSVLMWCLSFKTPQQKRDYLKAMHQDFLTSEYSPPPSGDGYVLFMRSLERDDYGAMFGAVFSSCSSAPKTYFASFNKTKVQNNAKAAAYFEENLDLEDWIDVYDPLDRQCAFVLLLSYCYLLEFYAEVKFKAIVTFSDMQPIENLFARYFRSKGIQTVSLQHGLYIDYGEYKTVNCINYQSHASDYYLVWGEHTAKLISAYHPDTKIVMCGKPLIFQGKASSSKDGGRSIMLVLDQSIFDRENYAMARIVSDYAKKHGYNVTVRFHPSLDKSAFLKAFPNIIEAINFLDADIVAGHTTSLLFEAQALHKRVVQYKTNIPTVDLPAPLQFKDLPSLEKAATFPLEAEPAKSYFCALDDASKQRYADFFRFLLEDDRSAKVEFYEGPKGRTQSHTWFDTMKRNFFEGPLGELKQQAAVTAAPTRPSKLMHQSEDQSAARTDRLDAIVIPCLPSDLPILGFIFDMWSSPHFAPSLTGRKVKLLLVFNSIDLDARRKVIDMWRARPKLSLYFDELLVESADLIGERDLYVKSRAKESKGKFGNIAGPNFLFQSTMNYASRFCGYVFQMEVDCFPLIKGWLEALDLVISRAAGAWVIGSLYHGDFAVNDSVKMHINGNALYKSGDPKFIDFINTIWIPRLLKLAKELPNLAYDCWWAFEVNRSKTNDLSPDSSWNLVRRYNSFFYNDPFIVNLLKSDPLEERFSEIYRFYESIGKTPIFLHYADCKALGERVLAGEAGSLRDLLLDPALISDDISRSDVYHAKVDSRIHIISEDVYLPKESSDLLTRIAANLLQHPTPRQSSLFLMSCAFELMLRPSECGKRIAAGGDMEKPLALALEHNTDVRAAAHLMRIRDMYNR
ncbi:hypothetical protein [Allochromatium vinosum]|uniref:hypothetical protein n=1 Tax=Allochromatium vinosum TaxID=1049 RepID=UPI001907EB5C|nr:hypothetical protein [Allochromatium vinosum]MBK1654664.1 hypothetical protein [Allochromatium vinosum]